jgi:hypothetical protein
MGWHVYAIGARILREYAPQIVLKPPFTILDRSDAADLDHDSYSGRYMDRRR